MARAFPAHEVFDAVAITKDEIEHGTDARQPGLPHQWRRRVAEISRR